MNNNEESPKKKKFVGMLKAYSSIASLLERKQIPHYDAISAMGLLIVDILLQGGDSAKKSSEEFLESILSQYHHSLTKQGHYVHGRKNIDRQEGL